MSFLIYQRSDPRYKEWIPLLTQQFRLRNLIQIVGVNLSLGELSNGEEDHQNPLLYYTLHLTPMSSPFFTSERLPWSSVIIWKELEPRQIPVYVPLSAKGIVIRIWSTADDSQALISWGLFFSGLHFLGRRPDLKSEDFTKNSIVFRSPFGFFTDLKCLNNPKVEKPERYITFVNTKCLDIPKNSYTVKNLASLHAVQRAVLEEVNLARIKKQEISHYGYCTTTDYFISPVPAMVTKTGLRSPTVPKQTPFGSFRTSQHSNRPLNVEVEKEKLRLREIIESKRNLVKILKDERGRCEGRVHRLKQKTLGLDERVVDLTHRVHGLGRERERLRECKSHLFDQKNKLADARTVLNLRKMQLISELLVIYPIKLVTGSKKYSIAEVQLPNAEDYGSESGTQVSCALGYTAHLIAVICFFLGVSPRYPILHFGSKSRIVDHITTQIPNKEREFPLHFRGREDVYSKYAVYLLNKNVAQLRWYCGLSTPDLRATLPNLYNLLTSRLIIPGWPPSQEDDSCELAEELTEETEHHIFRNDFSLSMDAGLDQIGTSKPENSGFEYKLQPSLRASFSDFEYAGGSAVPESELHHGREQIRFLSGWKKKTYSESEEIDPRWLTNSLSLELDLGRVSNTPSPPLRLPSMMNNEYKDITKQRKRRHGRVEFINCYVPPPESSLAHQVPGTPLNQIPLPDNVGTLTPNRSMNQVEFHINENERRKSVVETNRMSPGSQLSSHGKRPSLAALSQPTIDNYSTTDDEKLDDTVTEVVRRLSQVDTTLLPTIQSLKSIEPDVIPENPDDLLMPSFTITPPEEASTSQPFIAISSVSESLSTVQEETSIASGDATDSARPRHNDTSSSGTDLDSSSFHRQPPADIPVKNPFDYCDSNEADSDSTRSSDITKDLENSTSTAEAPDDSLWFRTEALMGSSFNLVRRRISESN